MDITKVQNLVNKINNLFQSIRMTENRISALEKDLMKSYLRELYELLDQDQPSEHQQLEEVSNTVQEIPKIHQEVHRSDTDGLDQGKETSDLKASKVMPSNNDFDRQLDQSMEQTKKAIAEAQMPPQIESAQSDAETSKEDIPPVLVQPEKPDPLLESVSGHATVSNVFNLDPEMAELFAESPVSDLSDKLSVMPIRDLSKAFGVNERILTINELFGGNVLLFTNTINSINQMHTFQEAKEYLVRNIAGDMQWTDDSKKTKASTFIKTVRRKFR